MDTYSYLNISAGPGTGALDLFVAGTEEVYTIVPVDRGWRFSRVTRRGTVSVTVNDGRVLSGPRILDALRIAAACPGGGSDLFAALKAAEVPTAPLRAPDDMLPTEAQLTEGTGTAIRNFLSGRDIEQALSFPAQATSAPFACTVLAPATAALRPAAEMDPTVVRLTTPIKCRFAVIYPEGVRPSAKEIDSGEELTLTYFAEGMTDSPHTLIAGKPSPFVEYDGAMMRVRPISALGITLSPLPEPEPEPAPAPSTDNQAESTPEPGVRNVTLALRFSDERVVKAEVSVKDDSSEYHLLRAGLFHGHRARRLAVKFHGDESYLIDLREDGNDPEEEKQDENKNDNVPADAQKAERRSSGKVWLIVALALIAIALGIVAVSHLPGIFDKVNTYNTSSEANSPVIETVTADPELIPSPFAEDTVAAPAVALSDTATQDSEPEPVIAPAPEMPQPAGTDVPEAVDPSADFAYLNRSNIWQRDSLSSPEGLAVFDVFATGNLSRIPQTPFFSSGKCTNPAVMKTVRLIWEAKGSLTQTGNQRALRRLEGKTMIDFDALFLELAGIRPSNPNNRPLPSSPTQ